MDQAYDAIIIGAGPAGSSAAILLARAGWRIVLVEKHAFPRKKVCGGCIAASNLPILHNLGIAGRFFALAGPPIKEVALACGERFIRAPMPRHSGPGAPWGVALSRDYLDALLATQARVAGVELFQPWIAKEIEGRPGALRCRIRAAGTQEEKVLRAPVLIDAHGSWEPLAARKHGRLTPHRPSDLFAFMTQFDGSGLEAGLLPVLSFPGGYGGMVVAGQGTTTLAFCLRRDRLEQARRLHPASTAAQAAFESMVRHCRPVSALLAGAHQRAEWMATGPLRPGIRLSVHDAAVFRVGNAAGEAHPLVGEGISMALQSAAILANVLIAHKASIEDPRLQQCVHHDYVLRWRRHFVHRIRLASLFAHAAMRPGLYETFLPLMEKNPVLLKYFALWCDKTRPAPELPPSAAPGQGEVHPVALQRDR